MMVGHNNKLHKNIVIMAILSLENLVYIIFMFDMDLSTGL